MPSIEFLWSYLPDLALVTVVATLLALGLSALLTARLARRRRPPAPVVPEQA
ncbi:hypothetical protein [Nostocoides japonicum]|uniref:hypothetical protein n=1 Tax=Nostocoides japonicum TaxID=99481 RepID=UPI000AD5E712|nr:hypothetical protein [Tetrasphaera japonica]